MAPSNISPKLLSTLYATASNQSMWQVFCDELKTASTVPIMMFGHNLGTDESLGIIASGLDPVKLDRYHHHFANQNPWMHMNAVMPVGLVGVSDQALQRNDLVKTEFYNDWLRPQENIVAGPFMMCHRSKETFVGMAAACPARKLDKTLPDSFELLEALALHMTQVVSMSSVLTNGGPTTFGHFEVNKHGIIVVCHSGRIALVNAAAERFLSHTHVMGIDLRERLTAKDEVVRTYLDAAQRAMRANAFAELPQPQRIDTLAFGECILHARIFPSNIEHRTSNMDFQRLRGQTRLSAPLSLRVNVVCRSTTISSNSRNPWAQHRQNPVWPKRLWQGTRLMNMPMPMR